MRTSTQEAKQQTRRLGLALGALCASLMLTVEAPAFPIGGATFRTDAPFQGYYSANPVTSSDGFLTVQAWADADATVAASLWQWWWILGVDSGVGNGALLDGAEAITLQLDKGVGASMIFFFYTGGSGGATNNLARLSISGFGSDPQAYATTYNAPRISNLSYANGTLTFDYLWDETTDYGQLLFANPGASAGQRLKITGAVSPRGDATGWSAGLYRASWQEAGGQPAVTPVNVRHNHTNAYTTADGAVTVRGFSDANATTPANLGTYLDQCFGVYGGNNTGGIEGTESVTLQFASGIGLSRLECVYSAGQVSISGFASDPGFTDLGSGSFGATYAEGVVSFYPMDGGRHIYFFTNRAASAGRTLRVNADAGYTVAISGIEYSRPQTVIAGDITSNVASSHTSADGLLKLNAYADTPGTVPANLYENVDWFGVAGGSNTEAIEGTESLSLQFSGGAGLSGLGTRYSSGQIVISGFASDPGFTDPSGTASGVSYSNGTLSYTFNQYRAAELVVNFSNVAASAGRTLSLHTDGSSESQIALTRINYAVSQAPVTLSIARYGTDVVLTWPTGTLQQSSSLGGAFSDIVGATSPYTNAISGQRFFRVKVQ